MERREEYGKEEQIKQANFDRLEQIMWKLSQANLNYAVIKLREHGEYYNFELEIVESEDCTNNLEEIVNNINIEDCGLSNFAGVNHHLQKEKAFVHKKVLEYRANKSRIYGPAPAPRMNLHPEDILIENEDVSRILGASILQPPKTTSRMRHLESQIASRSRRVHPVSQILPTESSSNLGTGGGVRPYSMRNVSPSSTFQTNVQRTREKLRKKSQNLSVSRIISHVNAGPADVNKSSNYLGFMSNSRMQKSLLTEMSMQSGMRPAKKLSNQSATWSLLNADLLKTKQAEQLSMVHTGNPGLDYSRRINDGNSIVEITPSIQNSMKVRPSSRVRKSVMHQYQRFRDMEGRGENLKFSSRQSKSQIEIGLSNYNLRRKKYGKSKNERKSWNGMTFQAS